MRVFYELRVKERHAPLVFDPDEGKPLSSKIVRKVVISSSDPRMGKSESLKGKCQTKGTLFSRLEHPVQELEQTELFWLYVESAFEPAGEECGTVYDYSEACPVCGGGRKLAGPLLLKSSKIPKRKLAARTIASEVVFSEELVVALKAAKTSGIDFLPVLDSKGKSLPWHQPIINSNPVSIRPPTRIGQGLFFDDPEYEKRCPLGVKDHVLGLNSLSEIFIDRREWGDSDFLRTKELLGSRSGLLAPFPLILVSQKVRQVLQSLQGAGYSLERVRFSDAV